MARITSKFEFDQIQVSSPFSISLAVFSEAAGNDACIGAAKDDISNTEACALGIYSSVPG